MPREALDQLKQLTRLPREEVIRDRTLRYSLRYAVILIVEALLDAAVAVLEKLLAEPPSSYRDAFLKARRGGHRGGKCCRGDGQACSPTERDYPPLLVHRRR